MSRKLIVEVVGDSRSLERSFARSTAASKRFGAETTTTLGKVDTGFTKLQKVAGGAFIGGAAISAAVTGLRAIVNAAQDSQETLGQTRVALEATGKSWADYGAQIEAAVTAQSKLGFDDEALLRTFSVFVRQTGDVGQALRENNIAMDLARARFIDLEQAAQIVNKAALGQSGALRRLGIDTKGATDGVALLALLEKQFGGAAEDASKRSGAAMDRLQVSLENVQETLGTTLLPAIADVADGLSSAADDADSLLQALKRVGDVKIPAIHIPFVFGDIGGGTVGGAVGGAITKGLKTAVKLQFLGITGTVASAVKDQLDGTKKNVQSQVDKFDFSFKLPQTKLEPPEKFAKLPGVKTVAEDLGKNIRGFIDEFQARAQKAVDQGNKLIATDKAKQAAEDSAAKAEKLRDARQAAFDKIVSALELTVDKAGIGGNLQKQLGALEQLKAGLERQIKAGVDVQSAQSQLVQVVGAIGDKQKEIQQKALEALQSNQFRALGLTAGGDALTPTVANLKKQLEQLSKNDLSSKAEGSLSRIGKVLSGSFGKVTEETRSAIKRMFDQIRGELDKGAKTLDKGPLTKTTALSPNKILAGLGLDRDTEKLLRARLSGFNSSGLALAGKQPKLSGSFSSAPVVVQSNVTVELDGDVLARSTTRAQQKAGRRNPKQKRGPNTRSGV